MSNVQPLPKYRVGQSVRMLTEQVIHQTEDATTVCRANTEKTVFESQVVERHYTPQLGWIYALKHMCGYVCEHVLMIGTEGNTEVLISNDPNAEVAIVDIAQMIELHAQAQFKVGDYVRIDGEAMDGEELVQPAYAVVMGVTYIRGELVYDCALKHQAGHYVEDDLGFGEEDLVPITDQERETLILAQRAKPKFTVVSKV